jgi:hypothetical protein
VSRTWLNSSIALCLIVLAATLRLLPHPENFAPIAAVAIFGGALLPRRLAVAVPVAAMVLTDLVIGWHDLILLVWLLYALMALASSVWLRKNSFARTAGLTLGSSVAFFVVTNFAVWVQSGMYEHTWAGLAQCFTLAIPFFRNSLVSDLFYVGLLFGAYALATRMAMTHSYEGQAA